MREQQVTAPMGLHKQAPDEFSEKKPQHLAIILQGHRAWAQKHSLSPTEAAAAGFRRFLELIDLCMTSELKRVTFCAFSADLQSTTQGQHLALLRSLVRYIAVGEQNLHRHRVRLCSEVRLPLEDAFIGRNLVNLSFQTRFNKGMLLNLLVDNPKLGCWNGPRQTHGRPESELDRVTKAVPYDAYCEPDFVIRTGGPMSVQNAMLWTTGRTALYFTDALWPDFDAPALKDALDWYGLEARQKGCELSPAQDQVPPIPCATAQGSEW
ncbi:MAG: hypothetical protein CVU22_04815 [Betaproteobacteria bacterium HGW-Betaproteobacteria-16]|nr:MAG: hypothetical protein CVU22_04815 [Betaproteobacteria bacterium HGW-Betaproteobacteria-16]